MSVVVAALLFAMEKRFSIVVMCGVYFLSMPQLCGMTCLCHFMMDVCILVIGLWMDVWMDGLMHG